LGLFFLYLYDIGNTDGVSGLSTPELKALIVATGIYGGKFEEAGSSDIDSAIKDYFWSYSPLIIYGNTYFGSAGGHYYVATGAIYCDDTLRDNNKCSYRGLYLNDSVFNSPAYPLPPRPVFTGNIYKFLGQLVKWILDVDSTDPGRAPAPSRFITADDLSSYWKPTGSALPWNKRHYHIRQGA
jgi:hypothetical protein